MTLNIQMMGRALVFMMAMAVVACSNESESKDADEISASSMLEIQTGEIERRYMSSDLTAVGQLESPPQNKVSLSVPMGATARKVNFHVGEEIRKGAVLAIFAHPDLIEVQREYLKTKSHFTQMELEWKRVSNLYRSDATSEREYEATQANFNEAKTDLEALQSKLEFLGYSPESIESDGIQKELKLISPIDGYIAQIHVNPGMYLEANKVAYELINRNELFISLRLYGAQLAQVQKGDTIRYTLSGDPQTYSGEVMAVAPTVSDEQTAEVHAHLENVPDYFRSGMHVSAIIELKGDTAWTLPNEAIWREGDQTYLFEKAGEQYVKRQVAIGRQMEGFTEILDVPNESEWTTRTWALNQVYFLNAREAS